jgi:predicted transcriptional regulator
MRNFGKVTLMLAGLVMSSLATAAGSLVMGQLAPAVKLDGDTGGRLNGQPWDSAELKGKLSTVWYVDPDESDTNNAVSDAVTAAKFPDGCMSSYAVINMAATWLPNVAIGAKLKSKQEKFPAVTYVKDLKKVLADKWGAADDSNNVYLFDKDGKLIWKHEGKVPQDKIKGYIDLIRSHCK